MTIECVDWTQAGQKAVDSIRPIPVKFRVNTYDEEHKRLKHHQL